MLAVVPSDSCVNIMKSADYIAKMQTMIDDGITCDVQRPKSDNTLKDLKTFREFLYRLFKDHSKNEDMLPTSSQPTRLYGTAKTHKFGSPGMITNEKLKFRPTIAQTGTYIYNKAQVLVEYLKPLVDENSYIICNT